MHSTMPVRPLPGASYHTLETVLHSFANVDLEAVGSFNAPEPSEKQSHPSNESTPLLDQTPDSRERNRRALPLLLVILVFFCLAFTASAFLGYSAHRLLMPDVPDRHASIAEHLSSALQAPSYRMLVNENYDGALVTMDQKSNCLRDGCHEVNVRDSLFRTFPILCVPSCTFTRGITHGTKLSAGFHSRNPSLNRTDIAGSAVVLHWQGTDSSLKPVLISNSDAVLDVRAPQIHAQDSSCGDVNIENEAELADVQSGVGMMIAVDALLRSRHQPSRTLILSLMLGEASDAPKVSEYLHATYGDLGLGMEFEPQASECRNQRFRASRVFRTLIGKVPGAVFTLRPMSSVSRHAQAKPFDEDEARVFRYIFSPTIKQATLTRLRVKATHVWARLILGADGF
ncbi:hypothetical protein DFH94DRAFT_781616 [Russula ochroleuca]|uniref:Uncharacterized protein n=1 Tax=Russula ochroleuca TaxID=152965 RepID=A0A9P5MNS4_9AGAM|nr:hypothetical protein DFH94DRAFT_781616 [Russula ochroleuca]